MRTEIPTFSAGSKELSNHLFLMAPETLTVIAALSHQLDQIPDTSDHHRLQRDIVTKVMDNCIEAVEKDELFGITDTHTAFVVAVILTNYNNDLKTDDPRVQPSFAAKLLASGMGRSPTLGSFERNKLLASINSELLAADRKSV